MSVRRWWLVLVLVLLLALASPAVASINDDNYDGNVFVLYGGNGSLVPPKLNLRQALGLGKPAVLVFYIDDSRDCKQFVLNLNRWQARFTPQLSIIPINVDSLTANQEEAQYFGGLVPQAVVIDRQGRVVLDVTGAGSGAAVDGAIESLFAAGTAATN